MNTSSAWRDQMKTAIGVTIALCIAVAGSARASDETVRSAPYDFAEACAAGSASGRLYVEDKVSPGFDTNQGTCQEDELGRTGVLAAAREAEAVQKGVIPGIGIAAGVGGGRTSASAGVFYTPVASGTLNVAAVIGQVFAAGYMWLGISDSGSSAWGSFASKQDQARAGTITLQAPIEAGRMYRIWVWTYSSVLTIDQIRYSLES